MGEESELKAEQAHVDRAYRRLDELRADTERLLRSVLDQGRGGTHQFREERDVIVRTSLARLDQLDIGDQALCFGRIDRLVDAAGGPAAGVERFHIGRLGVSGDDLEPLVVDWRAPVAEPFYRATGRDPMGLVLRRHLAAHGRILVGFEDERFAEPAAAPLDVEGAGAAPGAADGPVQDFELGGAGALLAALSGPRGGFMRDIVATIQSEQDAIIRAPLAGVHVVQGGPGTGKTAVALHRAAYLLYTHRFPLERQGVLVIGPNPLFLRYIEQVLPSLGESGVTLTTVPGLVHGVRTAGRDAPAVARLKGDARMAKVVARAVRTRQRPLRRSAQVPFGSAVLRLSPEESAAIVAAARRRPGTHNARRRFIEQQVVRRLADTYEQSLRRRRPRPDPALFVADPADPADPAADGADRGGDGDGPAPQLGVEATAAAADPAPEEARRAQILPFPGTEPFAPAGTEPFAAAGPAPRNGGGPDPRQRQRLPAPADDDDGFDLAEFSRQVRRQPELAEALDRMWPRLSAEELLHDLFGARPLLALAGAKILSAEEVRSLLRPRSPSLDAVAWTDADLALIDEARVLLGSRRSRPLAEDTVRTYGHIVVDEAQDLSPMQLRMVARRSLSGSITVVGDIGQATGSWAPDDWSKVTAHLPATRPPRLTELTVSYRTPAEVVAVAAGVLAAAAPTLHPPIAVRRTGVPPHFEQAADPGDLTRRAAAAAQRLHDEVAPGTTAVLAPESLVEELTRAFEALGVAAVDPGQVGLGAPLSLLRVGMANGLEFDAVVVVEPAAVVEESVQGLRSLYVALTRPTRRLAVIHHRPLPPALHPAPVEPSA